MIKDFKSILSLSFKYCEDDDDFVGGKAREINAAAHIVHKYIERRKKAKKAKKRGIK